MDPYNDCDFRRASEPRADDVHVPTGKSRLELAREALSAAEVSLAMADDKLANAQRARDLAVGNVGTLREKVRDMTKPTEPEVVTGTILTFEKTHERSGRRLTYAVVGWRRRHQFATKDENLWSLSGMESRSRTWDDLLDFAGEEAWPTFTVLREGLPKR